MFGKKKSLFVKNSDPTLRGGRKFPRTRTFKQSEFKRFDIPGELGKSLKRLGLFALFVLAFWFIYECAMAWNIFQ